MTPSKLMMMVLVWTGIGIFTNPSLLRAQSAQAEIPSTCGISTNIFGLATLNPTLDLEYSIYKSLTIGGTIWWEVRDVEDRWGELKLTYYPSGTAMRNFGISLTGGFHTAWKEADAKPEILDSESSATMGILASYSWRFLANKRLILSPVIGAKKAFSNDFAVSPLMKLYPGVKISFGYVF